MPDLVFCAYEVNTLRGRTANRPRVSLYSREYTVQAEDVGGGRCAVVVYAWDDEAGARADAALEFQG